MQGIEEIVNRVLNPTAITIPYNYTPREYQKPIMDAMDTLSLEHGYPKGFRASLCWHRRAGKDKTLINIAVKQALIRKGLYFYVYPALNQARKALWNGMGEDGFRFMDHIPTELINRSNETEMRVELKNGSIIQIVGLENCDSMRSTNPLGIVFSEFATTSPMGWHIAQPILSENNGWAIFISTPNGKNHFYEISMAIKKRMDAGSPDRFFQLLTIDDTKRADGSPVMTAEKVQETIESGMHPDMAKQEFYCSFEGSTMGSYYGDILDNMTEKGHLIDLPVDPAVPVDTWWDIGSSKTDMSNAIVFTQTIGSWIHVIDFQKDYGYGMESYSNLLKSKGYSYGHHTAPFDVGQTEWSTGQTRQQAALQFDIRFKTMTQLTPADTIAAVRRILPRCKFDVKRCQLLWNDLMAYRREWDNKIQAFKERPKKDVSSHGADAFGVMAVAHGRTNRKPTSYLHTPTARAGGSWMQRI